MKLNNNCKCLIFSYFGYKYISTHISKISKNDREICRNVKHYKTNENQYSICFNKEIGNFQKTEYLFALSKNMRIIFNNILIDKHYLDLLYLLQMIEENSKFNQIRVIQFINCEISCLKSDKKLMENPSNNQIDKSSYRYIRHVIQKQYHRNKTSTYQLGFSFSGYLQVQKCQLKDFNFFNFFKNSSKFRFNKNDTYSFASLFPKLPLIHKLHYDSGIANNQAYYMFIRDNRIKNKYLLNLQTFILDIKSATCLQNALQSFKFHVDKLGVQLVFNFMNEMNILSFVRFLDFIEDDELITLRVSNLICPQEQGIIKYPIQKFNRNASVLFHYNFKSGKYKHKANIIDYSSQRQIDIFFEVYEFNPKYKCIN